MFRRMRTKRNRNSKRSTRTGRRWLTFESMEPRILLSHKTGHEPPGGGGGDDGGGGDATALVSQWAVNAGTNALDIASVPGEDSVVAAGVYVGMVDFDPDPAVTDERTSTGDFDIYVAKYDSLGNLMWAESYGGFHRDYSAGVTVDGSGNIMFAGSFQSYIEVAGNPLWTSTSPTLNSKHSPNPSFRVDMSMM